MVVDSNKEKQQVKTFTLGHLLVAAVAYLMGGCGEGQEVGKNVEEVGDPACLSSCSAPGSDPGGKEDTAADPWPKMWPEAVVQEQVGELNPPTGVVEWDAALPAEPISPDMGLEPSPDLGIANPVDMAEEPCEPTTEACTDGLDNDCDSLTDAKDYVDCPRVEQCTKDEECVMHSLPESICADGSLVEYTGATCDIANGICAYTYQVNACADDEVCRRGECIADN